MRDISRLFNPMDVKVVTPANLGWLEYKLNPQEMEYLWRCIKNKKGDEKWKLAGNISASWGLHDRSDWFWMNTLKPLVKRYGEEFANIGNIIPVNQNHPYHLDTWWVNYQNQKEFNPLHNHNGVYSFVIWMKIPFKWDEQNKKDIARKSNSPKISNFELIYSNLLGEITTFSYKLAPQDEGLMLLFPSALSHQVYPFYDSTEDRISISGNVTLNTTKIM